ncbi:MAG: hypothetical protein U9N56_10700 [Actinomycetota bacterium]|nr:hypothetical protein [Actinomycetota bacterium]
MPIPKPAIWAAAAMVFLASCGGASTTGRADQTVPASVAEEGSDSTIGVGSAAMSFSERIGVIDEAVAVWRGSISVEEAHMAAETAANLVVGPNGPGYGDRNGDGVISGESTVGVLPGLDGTPAGLATPLAANECVARDVLGGTWTDPGAEWEAMLTAIDEWLPNNNTMPTLPSHPMRIVGWATFTLGSDSLDEAHEYAGHAKLHVDIALRALDC